MSAIDLLLDEENELTFQLNIEGNAPGTAKCRLKLENQTMSLLFEAVSPQKGEISVVLPPLSHVIKEGEYKSNSRISYKNTEKKKDISFSVCYNRN